MSNFFTANLSEVDPVISEAINNETHRQWAGLELIASENFVSEAVLQAMGSVFTNKSSVQSESCGTALGEMA